MKLRAEKSVLKRPSLRKQIVAVYRDVIVDRFYRILLDTSSRQLVWVEVERRTASTVIDSWPERARAMERASVEEGRLLDLMSWVGHRPNDGECVIGPCIHMLGKRKMLNRLPQSARDHALAIIMLGSP